ncbi:MAG TPA: hypothetical protein VFB38_26265 [Chthonomonadaceae bacterium]|nr:hypothetical protein [Chthonomonadaceae bacterium]
MEQTGAPRKRLRWLWPISLAALLLAFATLGAIWMSRPRWHTYTSPALAKTGLAVVIQYPEDWQPSPPKDAGVGMQIRLTHKPPSGFSRWLYQHIQHSNLAEWERDTLDIGQGQRRYDLKDIDSLERETQAIAANSKVKISSAHRFQHALGPALDGTIEGNFGSGPNGNVFVRGTAVFPDNAPTQRKVCLALICITTRERYPRLQAAFEGMVQRVRLVPAVNRKSQFHCRTLFGRRA